jgi:hypothetical protein
MNLIGGKLCKTLSAQFGTHFGAQHVELINFSKSFRRCQAARSWGGAFKSFLVATNGPGTGEASSQGQTQWHWCDRIAFLGECYCE